MGHEALRKVVKEAYPYKRWAQKVDRMSDAQVVALYFKLFKEKKI